MKKYFLFSFLVVFSFVFYSKSVSAGWVGYACTTKGWRLIYNDFRTTGVGVYNFAKGDIDNWEGTSERATVVGTPGLVFASEEEMNIEMAKCVATEKDDDQDDDQEGDLRVKLKTYDCNGNEESKKIEGSKVKLYERDGDKVETDKTNSKGEANFRDIETGKYKVKCEVDGYVSMKDKSKTAYESGYEKIKDGERATETCRLVKKSCNGKLAKTGGSLFSYFFGFIF